MKKILLLSALTVLALTADARADNLRISGYVQAMPVRIDVDLPEPFESGPFRGFRLQNRLNTQWRMSSGLTLAWQMRTRLFAGDLVKAHNRISGSRYAEQIDIEDGPVDLSWVIADRDDRLLHYIADRLHLDWQNSDWRVTVGRQRVNWGINTITNPNDLFNIYAFYEFDYPERPGADAVRVQYFLEWASRIEVAFSPARDTKDSVAAALYSVNIRGYDIQCIAGYFRNRFTAGGGWAGSIGESGFKGEVMFFGDFEDNPTGNRETSLIAALSADHMFHNGVFLVVEGLYNKEGGGDAYLPGAPLSPDNPSFSRFQFTIQGSYSFSPVWNGSLALIWYPDEQAVFVSPSVTHSLTQNIDVNLLAQIFAGGADSVFADTGSVVAGSVKWNF